MSKPTLKPEFDRPHDEPARTVHTRLGPILVPACVADEIDRLTERWETLKDQSGCSDTLLAQQARIDQLEANIKLTGAKLSALGSAWRDDWSDFDGRALRGQLRNIIDQPSQTLDAFLEDEGICPHSADQWTIHCSKCNDDELT